MRTVIIGGGAAGASCAARLRRLDENAEILILEKTNEISIASCGLPYHISGIINDRTQMFVSTPEKFKTWFDIDVRLNSEVIQIDREGKFVLLDNDEKISYDNLVLTPGAKPIIPDFDGMDNTKIFTVRTLLDADRLKTFIKNNNSKKAVVIGGGFIGVEMAENLIEMGLSVSLVEMASQILASLDEEIAAVVQNKMRDNGIELILSDGVERFDGQKIVLNSGKEVDFDIVIMAIGIKPEIRLAQTSGLDTDFGIKVNEYMQTSDENIYAAGDSTETRNFITGEYELVQLAGPANRQGRIVADNIAGIKSVYKNNQGTSVLKVFNLTAANAGLNEKKLIKNNIPYWKTFTYGRSHAAYYPGASQTLYKFLFSPEGKILGIQAVGYEGVAKRVDVISAIMRNNGSVQDMLDSELCYAPPYSSAKDPVNVLGMNADNILRGLIKPAYFEDLETSYLIDVRMPEAYKTQTIQGAVNLPINEIRNRLNEIPEDKKVVLFCNTGYTSYCAARILVQKGFNNVYSFLGGIELYKELVKNKTARRKNTIVLN